MTPADSPAERRLAEARERLRLQVMLHPTCSGAIFWTDVDDTLDALIECACEVGRERALSGQQDADAHAEAIRRHDQGGA